MISEGKLSGEIPILRVEIRYKNTEAGDRFINRCKNCFDFSPHPLLLSILNFIFNILEIIKDADSYF